MSKKIIQVGSVACGANPLFLISGPCVIEEDRIMNETAEKLKRVSEKLKIPVIYKSSFQKDNRSSLKYYQGPGLEQGLRVLERIKKDYGFPILTDVHYPDQVKEVAEVVDIIQIPAYLCMQTTLTVACARTMKAINIKHGQFLAPENMVKPIGKCVDEGNDQIILTERGYTFGYNDLVVDPRSFYHMNETGYPVVFDVTHSIRKYGIPSSDPTGGARQYLKVLARAGVASGVDGLFIETHPDPSTALCDAASQLQINELEEFLKPLLEIHQIETSYR